MTTSKYRYLGPYSFMVVMGQGMAIGDAAELDDEFITRIRQSGRWLFEPVAPVVIEQEVEPEESTITQ